MTSNLTLSRHPINVKAGSFSLPAEVKLTTRHHLKISSQMDNGQDKLDSLEILGKEWPHESKSDKRMFLHLQAPLCWFLLKQIGFDLDVVLNLVFVIYFSYLMFYYILRIIINTNTHAFTVWFNWKYYTNWLNLCLIKLKKVPNKLHLNKFQIKLIYYKIN